MSVLAAALLSVTAVAPAQAAPPAPQQAAPSAPPPPAPAPTEKPAEKPAPVDPARSSSGLVPRAQAGAAEAKAGLRRSTPPIDPDHKVTAEEFRVRAERSTSKSYVPAPPSSSAGLIAPQVAPPATPTKEFADECAGSYAASADEVGYVKNRYEWCRNMIAFHNIIDTRGNRSGYMWMDLTLIGYGRDDGTRNMRFFARPNIVLFGGSYTPTTRVKLNVVCLNNLSSCSQGDGESQTMAEWFAQTVTGNWLDFTLASDGAGGSGAELVQRNYFGAQITFLDGVPSYNGPYGWRCDSARYFASTRTAACVFFDVVPHLQYWLTNNDGTRSRHHAVAEHIRQAQDQPDTTHPPRPDGLPKVIPGKYTGEVAEDTALERISSDTTAYTENVNAKDRACNRIPTPDDMERPQCDEYPFATTWQGAGRGPGDFSVKYVPGSENESAGASLLAYYNSDRILWLPEDFFYVQILDNQPGDGRADGRPVVSAGPNQFGDEGEAVRLYGTVRDDSPQVVNRWTWVPQEGVDEGAECTFSDPRAPQPTITCDDDGVFRVTLTADDGVNPPTSASATVTLANVAPLAYFDNPSPWQLFKVNDQVSVNVPFSDVTNDRVSTCRIDYDQNGQTVYSWQTTTRTCGHAHVFNSAGMYTIEMRVTDDDGGTGIATVLVVVYDPNGGTANIDGSTGTPQGALTADPNVTGDTYVNMAAAYYTTSGPPAGVTKSWIQNHGFRMESTGLQWLVVTRDNKVAVRGDARLADGTVVQYVLYGWKNPDRIRLVVWNGTGPAIYDNSRSGEYDIDRIDPKVMKSGAVQIHR